MLSNISEALTEICLCGAVVAQWFCKPSVVGSNPTGGFFRDKISALLANCCEERRLVCDGLIAEALPHASTSGMIVLPLCVPIGVKNGVAAGTCYVTENRL